MACSVEEQGGRSALGWTQEEVILCVLHPNAALSPGSEAAARNTVSRGQSKIVLKEF